jgi:hypothetical protein
MSSTLDCVVEDVSGIDVHADRKAVDLNFILIEGLILIPT